MAQLSTPFSTPNSNRQSSESIHNWNVNIYNVLFERFALPNDIIENILDQLGSWVVVTNRNFGPYNPPLCITQRDHVTFSSTPFTLPQLRKIRKIILSFTSKDQGSSDEADQYGGTYHNSHSWWEVAILRMTPQTMEVRKESHISVIGESESAASSTALPYSDVYWQNAALTNAYTFRIQNNRHAGSQMEEYRIEIGRSHEIFKHLRPGDRIALLACARNAGWCNYVKAVGCTVFSRDSLGQPNNLTRSSKKSARDRKYQYNPLEGSDTIRLVVLKAGTGSTPLQCYLRNCSLASNPSYAALSYTWGDPSATDIMMCGNKEITITKNLQQALVRLRHNTEARTLWIDAICINQGDVHERSHQVQLMSRIYMEAFRVVIWLGEEDQYTTKLFNFILMIHRELRKMGDRFLIPFERNSLQSRDPSGWPLFKKFLQRPWFHRVWTFQEIAVSRATIVVVGNEVMFWEGIYAAAVIYDYYQDRSSKDIAHYQVIAVEAYRRSTDPQVRHERDLVELLRKTRDKDATDPRDKIFSLVGIASEGQHHPTLIPNYNKSFKEVYVTSTRFLLTEKKDLRVLSYVDIHKRDNELPSWVPDWRYSLEYASIGQRDLYGNRKYHAAGDSKTVIRDAADASMLLICGYRLDSIRYSLSVEKDLESHQELTGEQLNMDSWQKLVDELGLKEPYKPTGQNLFDAQCQTTTLGNNDNSEADDAKNLEFFQPMLQTTSLSFMGSSTKMSAPPPFPIAFSPGFPRKLDTEIQDSFDKGQARAERIRQKRLIQRSRTFVVTKEDSFGLAPVTTQVGDLVVVLLGGDVPFVLRPTGHGSQQEYRLIGECYLHGWMDGQARSDEIEEFLIV